MALSGAYYKAGQYDRSAAQCSEAIRLAPDDAGAHYNYALALAALGDGGRSSEQYASYKGLVEKKNGRAELQQPPSVRRDRP